MDGYEFIAALTAALSWPIAAVLLGITLRQPLGGLVARITSFKAAGVEMTVAERSATAVEELPPAVAGDLPVSPPFKYTENPEIDNVEPDVSANLVATEDVLRSAPAIILQAWSKLESILSLAAPGKKASGSSLTTSLHRLAKNDLMPEPILDAVFELRRIRNDVAHARTTVTLIDAMTFNNAVESVLKALRRIVDDVPDTSSSIIGQGDLATMNYETLIKRLQERFQSKESD